MSEDLAARANRIAIVRRGQECESRPRRPAVRRLVRPI